MTIQFCRVCGTSLSIDGKFEALKKYIKAYSQLTSIQLDDETNLYDLKICKMCIEKLQDFERFRNTCLQVHWKFTNKSEPSEYVGDSDKINVLKCEPEDIYDSNKFDSSNISDENDDDNDDGNRTHLQTPAEYKEILSLKHDDTKPKNLSSDRNPKSCVSLYKCDLCPKKFRVMSRLNAHKRAHNGLKPFECKLCGKGFVKSNSLKVHHTQKHTDNRISIPCKFPGCGQTYVNRQGLRRHWLRTHDPDYVIPESTVVVCDTCGKTFTTIGAMKKHKFIHTPNEMPFVCGACGKKFSTSHKLKEHTMRHEGIKNHTCSYCGLKKTTMHELKTHINNIHTKGRTYPCNICAMEFSNIGNLHRHVRIVHLGLKPYVCKICDRAFGKGDHLKRHLKSHNPSMDMATETQVSNTVYQEEEIDFIVEKTEPEAEIDSPLL